MKHPDRLDSLRVISPCDVPWSSMKGGDAVRFCGKCQKNVYNVANMTRQEALHVVERSEGRVCMQLSWRRDGTLATGDCWARLRRARRRGLLVFLAVLPVVLATQLWSQAFGLRALHEAFHPRRSRLAGEIASMPLPPPLPPGEIVVGVPPPPHVKPIRLLGKMAPLPPNHRLRGRVSFEPIDD